MLELEKKYWRKYRKEKKEIKEYNKKVNLKESQYYKIFNAIIFEYYCNQKINFSDIELLKEFDDNDENNIFILNEIKTMLEKKKMAKFHKENNSFIINYETILFLNELVTKYKQHSVLDMISILAFFLSMTSLFLIAFNGIIAKIIAFLVVVSFCLILSTVMKQKTDNILLKR